MSTGDQNKEQPSEQEAQMNRLRARLKVQRAYNAAQTLAHLSDNLLSNMSDHPDIVINEEALDKLATEINALQDKLIEAVKLD